MGKKRSWLHKNAMPVGFLFSLLAIYFLIDTIAVALFDWIYVKSIKESKNPQVIKEKPPVLMYLRLLKMASDALSKRPKQRMESPFWYEPYPSASKWKPCSERKISSYTGRVNSSNGFIMVSANGGLNQQRVAICNAVALASLLNASLVLPKFLYSNVWKDPSQFSDIYQAKHFINTLRFDVRIVKELPMYIETRANANDILITDEDIAKEAKPVDYLTKVLPILLKHGVVHFLGFGNRLGFDPIPHYLQRLRCKCNFHALKYVPKIQKAGSRLVQRIRTLRGPCMTMNEQLMGTFSPPCNASLVPVKYLALHLRFEIDMIAYSLCEFGGGEEERRELEEYREHHFPLLTARIKTLSAASYSPTQLRKSGKCPLTPEEAALILAGLGFQRDTLVYIAGSETYGGASRLHPLRQLYPNIVTKEKLLSPSELAPFKNFSSQMAALDFIACASADSFAMTDSGSQFSSLVSGFRMYFGRGEAPVLRPNKKELAEVFREKETISWRGFSRKVRRVIKDGQRIHPREWGKSIYRYPRCIECMCKSNNQ